MNIMDSGRIGVILGRGCLMLLFLVLGTTVAVHGQAVSKAGAQDATMVPATGNGVMIGGNLWETFAPQNTVAAQYWEGSRQMTERAVRMGNFDRQWSTPTHHWPGGWNNSNFWGKDLYIIEYNPDPTFNPVTIGGQPNPSNYGVNSGTNYAFAAYANKPGLTPARVVLGANDPARDYRRETKWVDATKRHHTIYEAGWPTTIGVDVKIQVDQYSLHWNAFDDFITMKVTLTNTGQVDLNCDGVAERTGNVIRCLAMMVDAELGVSARMSQGSAGRASAWGIQRRVFGYVGDNDPKGNPWAMVAAYPGESGPTVQDMGINDGPYRFYTDVWSGWSFLGVKDALGNDKQTIYGTHPIGTGTQRGWYMSAGVGAGAPSYGYPKDTHTMAMGTFYQDGGKGRKFGSPNLAPDPNFFASGTTGVPTSFIPKASPERPRGDRKLYSLENALAMEEHTHEPNWTMGFTQHNNFDGNSYLGIGPFSLNVGESMTMTFIEMGGFRLQGLLNALAAGRYVYENGDAFLDNYPAVPDMRIDIRKPSTPVIRWDNRAEAGPNFAGYKIYKTSLAIPINWEKTGMRVIDDYWKNMTPGETPDNLKVPMNPDFTAFSYIAGKLGAPENWGPYNLVKVIPAGTVLDGYKDNTTTGYNYSWADPDAPFGFKFWYYVSAYTNASVTLNSSYAGLKSATTTFVETSNLNRDGASGLWVGTYPFAYVNPDWPKTAQGLKDIGGAVQVDRYVVPVSDLQSGAVKISVKPNPYKKKALFDDPLNSADHKVVFYNLPPTAKITILDVVGQIVHQLNFVSTGPSNGTMYWNLFSKNGVEVASGLYVWVVEYEGGKQVGYLTVMR